MSGARDPVQAYLVERGCPPHVVADGLEGLIGAWEAFGRELGQGAARDLDDYLNDLDGRQIVADAWDKAPEAQRAALTARLEAADRRVRAATTLGDVCLWGSKVATRQGWSVQASWWYFAVPKRCGRSLRAAIDQVR